MAQKSIFSILFNIFLKPKTAKRKAAPKPAAAAAAAKSGGFEDIDAFMDTSPDGSLIYEGPDYFDFNIVGELSYQSALAEITGGPTPDGHQHTCKAILIIDDTNEKDKSAVRVEIEEKTVGYLSRKHAKEWRSAMTRAKLGKASVTVPAQIVGGWTRPARKSSAPTGLFGVKLDLDYESDD